MMAELLRKLAEPLGTTSQVTTKQCLDENALNTCQCIQSVHDDMNAYLLDMKDSADYVKSQDRLDSRLQELHDTKQENSLIQANKCAELKNIRAEEENLKIQVRRMQQEGEAKIRTLESRLENERGTFSAYLALCGDVRLGTAATDVGELRGCVSTQPSDEVTFSLDTRALTAVQLADRLWQLAGEGPEQHQQLEHQLKELDIADQDGKGSAPAAGDGEDKENEQANAAQRS